MSDVASKFVLGNCLRGYFEGMFANVDEAWSVLSRRFLMSFPSETGNGRTVIMKTKGTNPFGYEEWMTCREGRTSVDAPAGLTDDDVLAVASHSAMLF